MVWPIFRHFGGHKILHSERLKSNHNKNPGREFFYQKDCSTKSPEHFQPKAWGQDSTAAGGDLHSDLGHQKCSTDESTKPNDRNDTEMNESIQIHSGKKPPAAHKATSGRRTPEEPHSKSPPSPPVSNIFEDPNDVSPRPWPPTS